MMALLAPGTQHPAAQVAALTVALASAERLRSVAPVPTPPAAGDPTAAARPRTAAQIAALSFAAGPFRMSRTTPTGRTKSEEGPAQRGWIPPPSKAGGGGRVGSYPWTAGGGPTQKSYRHSSVGTGTAYPSATAGPIIDQAGGVTPGRHV